MPTPFMSNSGRRRRRRWPWILAVVVVLLAGGGLAAYLHWGKAPGDVTNPNAEFQDTDDQQQQPDQAQQPAKKKKLETFVWGTYGYGQTRARYLQTDLHPPFKPLWKYGGGDLIEFQPVLANGVLYFL